MDTILIATDFTGAARNALVYGVQLARDLQAKVVLLHVCKPLTCSADMIRVVSNEELMHESEQQLTNEVQSVEHDGVEVSIKCILGNITESIIYAIHDIQPLWVLVGMKAKEKTMRKIFGSTATSLSKHSPAPLIIVPEHAAYHPPTKIALANDLHDEADMHVLDPLQQLAIKFQSYMFIVRVVNEDTFQLAEKMRWSSRIKWHLKELHASDELLTDSDMAHAIKEFVCDHSIDLVAIIAHEASILQRIFTRDHIKELIFQTQVPILILPENNLNMNKQPQSFHYRKNVSEIPAINGLKM